MGKTTKQSSINGSGLRLLPKGFSPSYNEVIIGRGRKVVNHKGNQRFQDLIHAHLNEYSKAKSKASKSAIILRVLTIVKQGSPEEVGGFVKQDASTKRWYAMEESSARVSTAQAFRDALSSTYRSSKQYKQQRRWNSRPPFTSSSSSSSTSGSSETGEDKTPVESEKKEVAAVDIPQVKVPSTPSLVESPPSPAMPGLTGLRGILNSALDIMDDDIFKEDLSGLATPDRTGSRGQVEGGDLSALLDHYAGHVEITENPFEPTPLVTTTSPQGFYYYNTKGESLPKSGQQQSQNFSLRNVLTL